MKYFVVPVLLLLFSCNASIDSAQSSGYRPEMPELQSDLMSPEVLWSFGRLGSPVVSPDGQTVLYTVTYSNIEENKSYRDVYTISVSGGEAKNLTNSAVNEFNAVWRPDGRKIGYLSSASGSVQMWEMNP